MKKLNKNFIIVTLTIAIAGLVSVGSALAATNFSISLPQGTEYEPGDTFTANINISPDEKIYTAGIQLSYPANLLKVNSFEFASGWMAVAQEGYDTTIDDANATGLLIKTAGYPGGIDSFKRLGTITFEALNEGDAAIELTSDSLVLDAENTNVIGSLGSSQITIAVSEVIPAVEQEEEEEEIIPEGEIEEGVSEQEEEEEVPVEEETAPEEVIPEEKEEVESTPFVAAIGDILSFGTGSNWVVLLVVLVIAAAVIVVISYLRKKRRKKQF